MNRKLSDIAFERYEALYEAELYREKERPMWGSEHEQAARRKVYEAIIAECSAPEVCTTPEQLEAQLRGLMNPEGARADSLRLLILSMGTDHVIRGGPGPLFAAGWAEACEHWSRKLIGAMDESQPPECLSESQHCRKNNPNVTHCCSSYERYAARNDVQTKETK